MKSLVIQQNPLLTAVENFALTDFPAEQCDPAKTVKIKVDYSGLNYKDALAITAKGKIIRNFPSIAGIDFCGTVVESQEPHHPIGSKVLITGFGYGESRFGGLSEYTFAEPQHLVKLPDSLSAKQAMTIGTAGFTAMLCVRALQQANITPEQGEVIVTGASGGVGSTAVYILNKLGYKVVAVSGKKDLYPWLMQLGATRIIDCQEYNEPGRPLDKQQFAGIVDTVGGSILANLLAHLNYNGCAAICGLAQDYKLHTTVMPFILRNVRLQGVDSVFYPRAERRAVWQQLSELLDDQYYQLVGHEINLEEAPEYATRFINGEIHGRVVVKIAE